MKKAYSGMSHIEKNVALYGTSDMSKYEGEVKFLQMRIDDLERNKAQYTKASDYNMVFRINKTQKLFEDMIKGIVKYT